MRRLQDCFTIDKDEHCLKFSQKCPISPSEKLLVTEEFARTVYDVCMRVWNRHHMLFEYDIQDFASFCIDRGYCAKEIPDTMDVLLEYVRSRYTFEKWFKEMHFVFTTIEAEETSPYIFAPFNNPPHIYVKVVFDDALKKLL